MQHVGHIVNKYENEILLPSGRYITQQAKQISNPPFQALDTAVRSQLNSCGNILSCIFS